MTISKVYTILFAGLCMAAIVSAGNAPALPNPPTEFSASFFSVGPFGYAFTRTYYDQANQRARTDLFNENGEKTDEFLLLGPSNKQYVFNATSGECWTMPLSAWNNVWDYLNGAVYVGTQTLPTGKECEAWETKNGESSTVTCFVGNEPAFLAISAPQMQNTVIIVTAFKAKVDSDVFQVPSQCSALPRWLQKPVSKRAVDVSSILLGRL